MRESGEKRLQRVVATVCATLFALFAFLYVAVYQAPLLEAFYNQVATGKLNYNPWLVGGVVSSALTLLALWLNRLVNFHREWTALAYLPSTLLLAFITDIDRRLYTGGGISLSWLFIFLSGFAVYGFMAFVLSKVLFEKIKDVATVTNKILWRNVMLFVLQFCLVGTLSNNEENFKRETQVMSHCIKGDTAKALLVGCKSLEVSPQLTAMRAYILASSGRLGEKLFEYPQLYASEGLLPAPHRTSPLVPDSIYSMLGSTPLEGESATQFLSRIAHTDSATSAAREYYLSSLLLEKQLLEFKDEVIAVYGVETLDSLPKHYREALMLYADIAEAPEFEINDAAMRARLDKLRAEEAKHSDVFIRGNYIRLQYSNTYWWYFIYAN